MDAGQTWLPRSTFHKTQALYQKFGVGFCFFFPPLTASEKISLAVNASVPGVTTDVILPQEAPPALSTQPARRPQVKYKGRRPGEPAAGPAAHRPRRNRWGEAAVFLSPSFPASSGQRAREDVREAETDKYNNHGEITARRKEGTHGKKGEGEGGGGGGTDGRRDDDTGTDAILCLGNFTPGQVRPRLHPPPSPDGRQRLRPGGRAAFFPPTPHQEAGGGGGAHPGLPDTGRNSCWRNPFPPAGSGTEASGSPLPALTLPAAEGRGGPNRRHRRHRPSRCSSAAGVTAANGAASAGAGGPRSGAEPPPPAQPPRREGGGCRVRRDRGRRFPGVGFGRAAFPPPSPAALWGDAWGERGGKGFPVWGRLGAPLTASTETPGPSPQPQPAADCRCPTRRVKQILKCFGCRT